MDLSVKHLRDLFGGNIPTAQVLQGVATGLSGSGVQVVIDPTCSCPYAIKSESKIVLPAQVKSERALLIVSWHIDHESGHIIYSPPPENMVKAWKRKSKMLDVCKAKGFKEIPEELLIAAKFFHNMCEDARIEQLMISRFPGSKRHFIGGPIAIGAENLVEDTVKKAEELEKEQGLDHTPLSPFFVGQMHAHGLLGGKLGQREKDYVRDLMPAHVTWVLDAVDDHFGDIKTALTISSQDLADRTDDVVAIILDKVLPDASEAKEAPEGAEQGQPNNPADPFKDQFDLQESKGGGGTETEEQEGGEEGEEGEEGEGGGQGEGQEGDDDGEDDGQQGGGEDSSGEDSDESSDGDAGGSGAGDEGGDGDEESDAGGGSGGDGEETGEDGEESDGDGSGSGESDDESEDGDSEGDGGSDSSGDSEGDEEGEGDDSGEGDGEGDGQDDDTDVQAEPGDDGEPEDSVGGTPETGEINTQAQFDQAIEWAKEAQVDMAELMREGAEDANPAENPQHGDAKGATPGSPTGMNHAQDTNGMPDEYLNNISPGVSVVVISNQDLQALFDKSDPTFVEYDKFIQELMPSDLGPAARRLVGRFKSAQGPSWSGSRINPKMLQPIVSGHAHGRPLFMRRKETTQSRKGVVVQLAIDCSGSMCGGISGMDLGGSNSNSYYGWSSKFAIAHAAARSIARLLQSVKVPFSVMGFTTDYNYNSGGSYGDSRTEDIVNFLFKDFEEPWPVAEQQMLAMNPNTVISYKGRSISPATNSDGESLLWGATRLITREEDRKVMIVLSDGLPYAGNTDLQSKFLKWAVRRIEIAGIRIGGLGLGCDGVTNYYRTHELVDSFPPGWGSKEMAPLYLQEKLVTLIDRLAVDED